jgi:hypothetical protein
MPHITEDVDFVVMDGACEGAIKLLEEKCPWMSGVVCTTHSLDLFMEDIGKLEWASPIAEKARRVATYINNHHFTHALADTYCSLALLTPGTCSSCNSMPLVLAPYTPTTST